MASLMSSITIGISNFPFFAVLLTIPIFLSQLIHYRRINVVRLSIAYAFLLYTLCFFSLVFLPLPTMEQAANLSTHDLQIIPFHFVVDIIKESPLVISNFHTYLPALTNKAVLQVVFNILLVIPFGMFLRYYCHMSGKKIVMASFLLSLFIEIAQLTGLFFIFQGSYRLCDVDDLIANTLGGFIGFQFIHFMEAYLPEISTFDLFVKVRQPKHA